MKPDDDKQQLDVAIAHLTRVADSYRQDIQDLMVEHNRVYDELQELLAERDQLSGK